MRCDKMLSLLHEFRENLSSDGYTFLTGVNKKKIYARTVKTYDLLKMTHCFSVGANKDCV
jgi:hypothetical protein